MGWPCGHASFNEGCHVCHHCRKLEERKPAYARHFQSIKRLPGEAPRLMPCKWRGADVLGPDGRPLLRSCGFG